MSAMENTQIYCPYCSEIIEIQIDPASAGQRYVEDCSVCCSPILLHISRDPDGDIEVSATRESD